MNLESVKTLLEEADLGRVSVEPSNVTGSPYDCVYVYLTDRGPEGAHLLISDAAEFGEEGVYLGYYKDFEDDPGVRLLPAVELLDAARAAVR